MHGTDSPHPSAETEPPAIRLEDLRRSYPAVEGRREVLCGVDLEVAGGELVAVVGRSGSGKTTLLNILAGLDTDYRGVVTLAGRDLRRIGDREVSALRNRTVGLLFQAYNLLGHLNALENVTLPWLFDRGPEKLAPPEARRRADEVLESVGLGGRGRSRPGELSGGEQQRLALARALFQRPRILLCDEPTGNLDPATGREVASLLAEIHRRESVTVLVATHDSAISGVADRALELRGGRLEAVP